MYWEQILYFQWSHKSRTQVHLTPSPMLLNHTGKIILPHVTRAKGTGCVHLKVIWQERRHSAVTSPQLCWGGSYKAPTHGSNTTAPFIKQWPTVLVSAEPSLNFFHSLLLIYDVSSRLKILNEGGTNVSTGLQFQPRSMCVCASRLNTCRTQDLCFKKHFAF